MAMKIGISRATNWDEDGGILLIGTTELLLNEIPVQVGKKLI